MSPLLPIIEQALVSGLLSRQPTLVRKNKFGLGLAVLSGLFFVAACFFVVLSFYGWLLTLYAQPVAALIVSGVVLGLSLLSALCGYALLKKRKANHVSDNEMTQLVSEVAEIIGEELAEPIQQHPKTAMALAGLAGFVAADHLH